MRLVCFDLDGTLVDDTIFIWQTLHDHFQTDRAARKRARQDFFAGRISYCEWFEHDMVMLTGRGMDRASLTEVLKQLKPMTGAAETLENLHEQGVKLAVISGSLNIVLDHFFPGFPFVQTYINRVYFNEDGEIIRWRETPYDMKNKADGLLRIALQEDIPLSETAFVGDNFNDLEVVRTLGRAGGLPISFNSKSPELDELAAVRITEKDLRLILPHVGTSDGAPVN